jgi:hypothetical protein
VKRKLVFSQINSNETNNISSESEILNGVHLGQSDVECAVDVLKKKEPAFGFCSSALSIFGAG